MFWYSIMSLFYYIRSYKSKSKNSPPLAGSKIGFSNLYFSLLYCVLTLIAPRSIGIALM